MIHLQVQGNLPMRGNFADERGNLPMRGEFADERGSLPMRGKFADGVLALPVRLSVCLNRLGGTDYNDKSRLFPKCAPRHNGVLTSLW